MQTPVGMAFAAASAVALLTALGSLSAALIALAVFLVRRSRAARASP